MRLNNIHNYLHIMIIIHIIYRFTVGNYIINIYITHRKIILCLKYIRFRIIISVIYTNHIYNQ